MNFNISANTDIGTRKKTNQDSLSVKVVNTKQGRMTIAVLCDGMGGLEKGEMASASVIKAMEDWTREKLPILCEQPLDFSKVQVQWETMMGQLNHELIRYGNQCGVKLGTTVVAMLITESRYLIMNVGDSRAYEITDSIIQLTEDHSLVAREVALGKLTKEEAETDKRNNILLQCVGASGTVSPDFFVGATKLPAVYMLCSDGFRHYVKPHEMFEGLNPKVLTNEQIMYKNGNQLIELNKMRNEKDNISVALIRTC